MSHQPDDPHRDHLPDGVEQPEPDPPVGDPDLGAGLDEEAAWRLIVENYGERPQMGADPAPVERVPDPFDRSYLDSLEPPDPESAPWEDEGHFVPPEPPPLPRLEPRRKLAWGGLFGSPVLLLLAVVFGWVFPTWMVGLLVAAFVGGFVYLVATMPRNRGDHWSGDDGAVV
jgi:hypothetical protein